MPTTAASLFVSTSGGALLSQVAAIRDLGRRVTAFAANTPVDRLAKAFADGARAGATDLGTIGQRFGVDTNVVAARLASMPPDDAIEFDAALEAYCA